MKRKFSNIPRKVWWFLIIIILVIALFRVPYVGSFIDDFTFKFLFGDMRFVVYAAVIFWLLMKIIEPKRNPIGQIHGASLFLFFLFLSFFLGLVAHPNVNINKPKFFSDIWSFLKDYWNTSVGLGNWHASPSGFLGFLYFSLFANMHQIGLFFGYLIVIFGLLFSLSYLLTNHWYYFYVFLLRYFKFAFARHNVKTTPLTNASDEITDKIPFHNSTVEINLTEVNKKTLAKNNEVSLLKPRFDAFSEQNISHHEKHSKQKITPTSIPRKSFSATPVHVKVGGKSATASSTLAKKDDEVIISPFGTKSAAEIAAAKEKILSDYSEKLDVDKDTTKLFNQPFKSAKNEKYQVPPLTLFKETKAVHSKQETVDFIRNKQKSLEEFFTNQNIALKISAIHVGQSIIQFECQLTNKRQKVSTFHSLYDDLKLQLGLKKVMMQIPLPNKSSIGIEIENPFRENVSFPNLLNENFKKLIGEKTKLGFILGKDVLGKSICAYLESMPHLLIAGATGSGKSVCINSILCSLLATQSPHDLRLILVDPKKVELIEYNDLPHLLTPVISSAKEAEQVLNLLIREMDARFVLFKEKRVRNINEYNKKFPSLPKIVAIIDELADLMLVSQKSVEASIMRLTQLARAAGIHLIVATQRPSVEVITGTIKSNIPTRIAFAVASGVDSRTILDQNGAQNLFGKGDMFVSFQGEELKRLQGAFIDDESISQLCSYIKKHSENDYIDSFNIKITKKILNKTDVENKDPLFHEVLKFAISKGEISTSAIQRRFKIGYNHAARIVDQLEAENIVGPPNGSKPRKIIYPGS